MHLTEDERAQFHREGWLIKPDVFDAAARGDALAAIAEAIDQEVAGLRADGWRGESHDDADLTRRLTLIRRDDREAGDRILGVISGGRQSSPAMLRALRNESLLEVVADLVGDTIVGCSAYRIRPKLPGLAKGEVPWHQDSGYFMPHCDRHLILTAWVALVDATPDNGCMYVLPRMHTEEILEHRTGGHAGFLVIDDERLEARKDRAVCAAVPAGGVVLMTNLTPHASFANTTDRIRWSLDLRYQGAETPTNVGEGPEDATLDRDPVTMACYPPEADFVVRDPVHPEREIRDHREFDELRQRFFQTKAEWTRGRWRPVAEGGSGWGDRR